MTSSTASLVRRLPPLPTINDILRMYGIRAKKSLSQNFIMDPRILKKFAKSAGDLTEKYVIEVGPGPGGITRALIDAGAKEVHVIEKDSRFLPSLNLLQEAAGHNKLHINIGDCLQYNPEETFPKSLVTDWNSAETTNLVLVGNLPFNVATPLLLRLLQAMYNRSNIYSYGRIPAVLSFQHEVAQRMAAPPGDPERSRLSTITQNWAEVDYIYNLPGGAFVPRPNVEVGIVKLTPHREPYIKDLSFTFINKVMTAIFHGKQKKLKNSLAHSLFPKQKQAMSVRLLDMAKIHAEEKAINLTMDDIGSICYAYKNLCEENEQIDARNDLQNYMGRALRKINRSDEEKREISSSSSISKSNLQFDIRL